MRRSLSASVSEIASGEVSLEPRRKDARLAPLSFIDEPTPPAAAAEPKLPAGPGTSPWWSAYYRKAATPANYYLCAICDVTISQPPGSTGNLKGHYRSTHREIVERLDQLEPKQNPSAVLRDYITQEQKKRETGRDARDQMWRRAMRNPDQFAREAVLLLWMTKRAIPFDAVGDPLFKHALAVRTFS